MARADRLLPCGRLGVCNWLPEDTISDFFHTLGRGMVAQQPLTAKTISSAAVYWGEKGRPIPGAKRLMTEPFLRLQRVLDLPCLSETLRAADESGVGDAAASTAVVSNAVVTEQGSVVVRDPRGFDVAEFVPVGAASGPHQVEVLADVLPWRLCGEITALLFDEARRVARRSSSVLQALAQADHAGSTCSDTVELLAKLVERPVSFKDASHALMAWSGAFQDMDPVRREVVDRGLVPDHVLRAMGRLGVLDGIQSETRPFRVDGDEDLGMAPRVVCPVRGGDVLFGYLSIAEGSHPLDSVDYLAVETGATVLSFQRARQRAVAGQERSHRTLIAYDLVFGPGGQSSSISQSHANALAVRLELEHRAIVMVMPGGADEKSQRLGGEPQDMLATLDEFLARQNLPSSTLLVMENTLCIFVAADRGTARKLAEHAADEVAAYHPVDRLHVGVSNPHLGAARWKAAWEEARLAAYMSIGGRQSGRVMDYRDLGGYRLLDATPPEVAEEHLGSVLGTDPQFRAMFAETFGALVANSYNKAEASRVLYVHVNTVRYRLSRIEEVTGWSPSDPAGRFTLECTLRLLELRAANVAD